MLTKDAGECVICLEELLQGDTIARLPCLCIYHKRYEAAAGPAQPHPRGLFPAGSGGQGQTLFASYLLLNDLPTLHPSTHPWTLSTVEAEARRHAEFKAE